MYIDKSVAKIIRNKPDHFKGTRSEWRKLIKSILVVPSQDYIPEKNKDTGEWTYVRVS